MLQTEGDAALLVVEVKDYDVDLLVEGNDFVRIADAAPAEVGDVDESIYATQIDEYAVGGDILDRTFENLTFLEFRDDFLLLSLQLGLDECLVRDNHVAELLIDFHNLELHRLAHEHVVVADGVNVDLAAGQECLDAKHIDNHTALRAALDVTRDDFFLLKSLVHTIPALREACLLVRKHQLTFLVLSGFNINFHLVADFQIGVVAEFRGGNDSVALVTNVHDYFLLVDVGHSAINDLVVGHLVEGFVVSVLKLFAACADC